MYGNLFKIQLKGCYRMETNSKAFAIPILTAIIVNYKIDVVRIGVPNALEFVLILKQPFNYIFNLFLCHFIPNLLVYFLTFDPYSLT